MEGFAAKRFTRSYSLDVTGSPDEVFRLLCPVREYEWIDGWKCELIWSESGVVEEGCIFTSTELPVGMYTVWVTTVNDTANRLREFVRVTPGLMVVRMQIKVEDDGNRNSMIHSTYTFTGLTDEGNAHLEKMTEDNYRLMDFEARGLGRLLDHFMRTGSMLERKDWPM